MRVRSGVRAPVRLRDWNRPHYITLTFSEMQKEARRRQARRDAAIMALTCFACLLMIASVVYALGPLPVMP